MKHLVCVPSKMICCKFIGDQILQSSNGVPRIQISLEIIYFIYFKLASVVVCKYSPLNMSILILAVAVVKRPRLWQIGIYGKFNTSLFYDQNLNVMIPLLERITSLRPALVLRPRSVSIAKFAREANNLCFLCSFQQLIILTDGEIYQRSTSYQSSAKTPCCPSNTIRLPSPSQTIQRTFHLFVVA